MPRPVCCRTVGHVPGAVYFKPRGIPLTELDEVMLGLDECETLRLADFHGMYHEEAAAAMNVSRQTFGRILESARKKVADALLHGKALRIGGGPVTVKERGGRCRRRRREAAEPTGGESPSEKPRDQKNRT